MLSQSHNLLSSISASTVDIPNLKTLNLSSNRLQAFNAVEVLLQCAAFCTALESLNLGLNNFEDDDVSTELSKLGLPLNHSLSVPGLSTNFSYMEKLARSLKPKSQQGLPDSLRKSFECNGRRVVSVLALAAEEKDRSIRTFRVQNGDFSSLLLPERIDFHLQALLQRLVLDLDSSRLAVSVKCLNLSACNLSCTSHVALAGVLQHLPALIELNLSLNRFPAGSILSVLQEAPSSLKTLIIRNACICSSGLLAAKRDLSFKFPSMTSFDVSDNSELHLDGLIQLLRLCPMQNLTSLLVSNCGIDLCHSHHSTANLLSAMRQATLLQSLDISKNSLGYDAVKEIIYSFLPEHVHKCGACVASDMLAFNVCAALARPVSPWTLPLRHLNISCTTPGTAGPNLKQHFSNWFNSALPYFCNLTQLRLSENACLVNLNPIASCLPRLEILDVSNCKNLIAIPDELIAAMQQRQFQMFFLGCDALQHPPKEVACQGPSAMLQYIQRLEKVRLNHVKIIVLGNGGTGKRSLLRALADLQDSETQSFDDVNQRIVQRHTKNKGWMRKLGLASADSAPALSFWTFGGNLEHYPHAGFYMSAHQCVYIVLFNASDPHEVLEQQISNWLRAIYDRAGCSRSIRILLVGSHIDQIAPCLLEARKTAVCDLIRSLIASIGLPEQFDASQFAVEYWFSANPKYPKRTDHMKELTAKIFDISVELMKGPDALLFPAIYIDMKKEVLKLAHFCEETKKLPFIKLSDIKEEDGYKILVGCHQHSHKLQAVKLLNDAGLLISYVDSDGEPWICVNLTFCADVVMLFTNAAEKLKSQMMFGNECVMSKDQLYQYFQQFFENATTSVSWYSSVLISGRVDALFTFLTAQGLLLPVSARQFRPELLSEEPRPSEVHQASAASAHDKTLFMLPVLAKPRPKNWSEVFHYLVNDANPRFFFLLESQTSTTAAAWEMGKPCRIKGLRFSSSSVAFTINVSQFLTLMLLKCHDSRLMWGFSFMYHAHDGTSVFVRLAENRRGADIITIGADAPVSPAVSDEIRQLVHELRLDDCAMQHICPLCCMTDDYLKTGSVHVFSQPQLVRFQELSLCAVCNQLHHVEAFHVQHGLVVQMPAAIEPVLPFFSKITGISVFMYEHIGFTFFTMSDHVFAGKKPCFGWMTNHTGRRMSSSAKVFWGAWAYKTRLMEICVSCLISVVSTPRSK
jgi:Leucine-rich repeat (LRR) protein